MRTLLRALPALFLVAAPLAADIRATPRVEVVPVLGSPLLLTPILTAPRLAARVEASPLAKWGPEHGDRAAVAARLWTELEGLPSLSEPVAYSKKNGLRTILLPFDGQRLLGLDEDSLAQMEPEDRLVYMNWGMIGPDLRDYEAAGLSAYEARRVVALSLAPVAGHEFLHAQLRSQFDKPFPGLKEEEILTHLAQAEAFDEVLRQNPDLERLQPLLDRGFLYPHNRKSWERWRQGFGSLADYVKKRYSDTPSLNDDPSKRAAEARAQAAAWQAHPGTVAPIWLTRTRQAAA